MPFITCILYAVQVTHHCLPQHHTELMIWALGKDSTEDACFIQWSALINQLNSSPQQNLVQPDPHWRAHESKDNIHSIGHRASFNSQILGEGSKKGHCTFLCPGSSDPCSDKPDATKGPTPYSALDPQRR